MKNLVIHIVQFLLMACITLAGGSAYAQDIHFSQFYEAPLLRNPSLAGIFTGDIRAQLVYRDQWNSFTNAYRSGSFNAEYKMPVGIYVTQLVSNLAAEEAGIRAGDVITKFNGEVIKTMEDLQEQLQYCKAGDKVTITVQRSEKGQYKAIDMKVKLSKATDKKN